MKIYQKEKHKFVDELMDKNSGRNDKEVKPVGVMDMFLLELSIKQISRAVSSMDTSYNETIRIIKGRTKRILDSRHNYYSTNTTIFLSEIITYYAECFLKIILKKYDITYNINSLMNLDTFNEKVDYKIKDCSYSHQIKKVYENIYSYRNYTGERSYFEDDLNIIHLPVRIKYAHGLTQLINEISSL